MKRILSRRPSPALVIACMSLFVALGGVSYAVATGSIDSREIKNNSVTGADVKNRSLIGTDIANDRIGGGAIKESTLGKVPSAATSDNAANSANAANAANAADAALLGGLAPASFRTRWALVDESGAIVEQSGGFTVVSRPGINGQPASNPNIYIDAGSSLVGKGLQVSTAIQNRIDRDADTVADPAFSGDSAVARCNTVAVNCVPAGTNTDNTLVVRSLVDNTNFASQTRRFYVEVSE